MNDPFKLKCSVHNYYQDLNTIKWLKNGHRITASSSSSTFSNSHKNRNNQKRRHQNILNEDEDLDYNFNNNDSNDVNSNFIIKKNTTTTINSNDLITYTTLHVKHASLEDAGIYMCKFGHVNERLHVEVVASSNQQNEAALSSAEQKKRISATITTAATGGGGRKLTANNSQKSQVHNDEQSDTKDTQEQAMSFNLNTDSYHLTSSSSSSNSFKILWPFYFVFKSIFVLF